MFALLVVLILLAVVIGAFWAPWALNEEVIIIDSDEDYLVLEEEGY